MLPIHDAAMGDGGEVIRELVAHGADLNARTRDEQQTPLHLAAMGRVKAVEVLVGIGAELGAQDAARRTALEAAERVGLTEVAAILKRDAARK